MPLEDRLLERDWRFIVDSIYQMNLCESKEHFIREMLESVSSLIPADQVMYTPILQNPDRTIRALHPFWVGEDASYIDDFNTGDYDGDAYFRCWNLTKETNTFRDTDMMSDEYRTNTRLYKEIYAKQGIHYALRSYLVYKGMIVGNISIFNHKEHGDFSDRDLFILKTLAPHVSLKIGQMAEFGLREIKKEHPDDSFNQFNLTEREKEIATAVINGIGDDEIADRLCISRSTFKKHIYNIYKKTDVNNRMQLYALLHSDTTR